MLSLFIMYSNDRAGQLDLTLACLREMKYYDRCQKTLVVDGRCKRVVQDFDIISVPRIANEFCWAHMWNAGVATARHPVVLYLDSDRLLPANFLEAVLDGVKDDVFVFTSYHFMVQRDMPLELCKDFLENFEEGICLQDRFLGRLRYEPRFLEPVHGPGKNVMSGSTGFTRKTYLRLGGMDPWYRGHGAYADTDFHLAAAQGGCTFLDLGVPELHYHHTKTDANDVELDELTLHRLGLDNFIYYCWKWKTPKALAEVMALRCRILNPFQYVKERFERLEELKLSPGNL